MIDFRRSLLCTFPQTVPHTLIPCLLHSQLDALPNSYSNAYVPSRETVGTIFMMVFGMTRLRSEPAIYHMNGDTLTPFSDAVSPSNKIKHVQTNRSILFITSRVSPSLYPQPLNVCMEAVIDHAMRTWIFAH